MPIGVRAPGTKGIGVNYLAPGTVEEAAQLLASTPAAKVFAGATDVIPQIRAGRPEPETLIDLKGIDRLTTIAVNDQQWTIGAAVPTVRLTEHGDLVAEFPGLVEAAGLIGSDQIQSRCTLGGNLCNASPAADSVPAMIVNGMRAVVASGSGTRTAPVAEIVTGPGATSLAQGEFIIEFELDRRPVRTGDAYLRMIPRTEMDIAVVGAGVRVSLDADGVCSSATVALGAVAPTAVLVPDGAQALIGQNLSDGIPEPAVAALTAAASAVCNPIDDKRGTIAYRRQVAGVLAKRAATAAAARAVAAQD